MPRVRRKFRIPRSANDRNAVALKLAVSGDYLQFAPERDRDNEPVARIVVKRRKFGCQNTFLHTNGHHVEPMVFNRALKPFRRATRKLEFSLT